MYLWLYNYYYAYIYFRRDDFNQVFLCAAHTKFRKGIIFSASYAQTHKKIHMLRI